LTQVRPAVTLQPAPDAGMNARPSHRPRTESVFGTLLVRGLARLTLGAPGFVPLCDVGPAPDAGITPWQQPERIEPEAGAER
jgi:hypothetical protein